MPTRNYLILTDDMSVTERRNYRLNALAAGLERCGVKNIGNIEADVPGLENIPAGDKVKRVDAVRKYIEKGTWPASLDQRELAPLTDLVVPTALDSWLTAAFAAVAAFYSCFQAVAAPQLLQGLLMVCYGVSIESAAVPMPASRLVFRRGGAAGNIQAQFDMEPMGDGAQRVSAFLSEPVIIDPQEIFAVQVRCRNATAAAEIVHIHNFLFETAGNTIA